MPEYDWIDLTPLLPDTPSARSNGRTHGVVLARDGRLVVLRQADPAVVLLDLSDPDRPRLAGAWGSDLPTGHGLTLVGGDAGEPALWITDEFTGLVGEFGLDGTPRRRIAPPPPERRVDGLYRPTWAAVSPLDGDVWVADGYGSNLVHRHRPDGTWRMTLTGEEGPGRFLRPHGLAFSPAGELLVTDRRRKRIVVYDADGNYRRHVDGVCHSPCMFAFRGGDVIVPELFGAVKVLDEQLRLREEIGTNADVRPPNGWPDQEGWGFPTLLGWPDDPALARPGGRFVAPHAVAAGEDGDLFVVEWVLGGRVTWLRRR